MGVNVPPGYVQSAARWVSDGDPEEQITLFGFVDLGPYADPTAHATSFAAALTTNLTAANMMGEGWTFVGVTSRQYQDDGSAVVGEANVNLAETGNFETPPSNTSILVRKATNRSGRQGQGRHYLPAALIAEGDVSRNGQIVSGQVATLQTRVTAVLDAMDTAYGEPSMVLFHSDADVPDIIVGLSVDDQVATQRTRMRR